MEYTFTYGYEASDECRARERRYRLANMVLRLTPKKVREAVRPWVASEKWWWSRKRKDGQVIWAPHLMGDHPNCPAVVSAIVYPKVRYNRILARFHTLRVIVLATSLWPYLTLKLMAGFTNYDDEWEDDIVYETGYARVYDHLPEAWYDTCPYSTFRGKVFKFLTDPFLDMWDGQGLGK